MNRIALNHMKGVAISVSRARRGRPAAVVFLLLVLGGSTAAHAHLVTTGLGPVYDGVVHLALSPADLAIIVVLTLLAAMRGARAGRALLALLPVAWLAGGAAGLSFPLETSLEWATGLSLMLAGALVAADRDLPLAAIATPAAIVGFVQGLFTGSALASTPSGTLELAGTVAALIVAVTLVGGLVASLRVFWARIVVRMVGGWIAAIGLLMIGWCFRAVR